MPPLFPEQTPEYLLSFQFSQWYPKFTRQTIKSSIIRPLDPDFCEYLRADGIFVPQGSEDMYVTLSSRRLMVCQHAFVTDLSRAIFLTTTTTAMILVIMMITTTMKDSKLDDTLSPNSTPGSGRSSKNTKAPYSQSSISLRPR
jgi:D123